MKTFRLSCCKPKLRNFQNLGRTGLSILLLLFTFSFVSGQEDCPELISFDIEATEVCEGEFINILYEGTPGASVTLDIPGVGTFISPLDEDGFYGLGVNPSAGSYTASLVEISTDDCTVDLSDWASMDFTVIESPEVTSFIVDPIEVCDGETTYLIAEGTPDATVVVNVSGYGDVFIDLNGIGIGSESIEFEADDYAATVISVYDENCSVSLDGDPIDFSVNPNPALFDIFIDDGICDDEITNFSYLGTPNATITINIPGVGTYTPSLNDDGYFTGGLNLDPATYIATLISIALDGCETDLSGFEPIEFTVFPLPELTSAMFTADEYCVGEVVTIDFVGTPFSTINLDWPPYGNFDFTTNEFGVLQLFDDEQPELGETTITLNSITSAEGCVTIVDEELTFLVKPNPELTDFWVNESANCDDELSWINFEGTPGAMVNYEVTGPAGTSMYTGEISEIGNIGYGYDLDPGDYTTTVVSIELDGCEVDLSEWSSIDFSVLALPELTSFSVEPAVVCEGEATLVSFLGTPGAIVSIEIPGVGNYDSFPLDENGEDAFSFTADPGEYTATVTLIYDDNCSTDLSAVASIDFEVLSNPTIYDWYFEDNPVCDGEPLVLVIEGTPDATVTLNDELGTVLLDADGEGSLDLYFEPGTGTISFDEITLGDCSTDLGYILDLPYEVYTLPELIDFYVQETPVCDGEPTWITVQGQPNAIVSLYVDGIGDVDVELDGAGFANYGFFAVAGVYSAYPTNIEDENCSNALDWTPIEFEVLALPELTSITVDPDSSCEGEPTFLFLEGTPDATISITVNGDAYDISLNGSGLGSTTLLLEPGTYEVQPVEANDACTSDLSGMAALEFTVKPNPELLTFDVTPEACDGEFIWLTFTGTPGAYAIVDISGVGTFATDAFDEEGSHGFNLSLSPGDYTATLSSIILDGCVTDLSDWAPVDFTVLPLPELTSQSFANAEVCEGEIGTYIVQGSPNMDFNFTIPDVGIYDFSTDENGYFEIGLDIAPGEYDFTLNYITLDGCEVEVDETIVYTVKPNPQLFDFSVTEEHCDDEVTVVSFNGTPGAVVNVNIPGIGNYDSFPLNEAGNYGFTFNAGPGTYVATLTTISLDGCVVDLSDWDPIEFTILPLPEVTSFSVSETTCIGEIIFVDIEGTPGASGSFIISDEANVIPIPFTFDEDGLYSTSGTLSSGEWNFALGEFDLGGCIVDFSDQSIDIVVYPYPELDDFYMGPSTTCEGDATYLLMEGTPGATVELNIDGIGDMTVVLDEDGEHAEALMPEAGTYTASLSSISMNGCSVDLSEWASIDFTVLPSPELTSFIAEETEVCSGEPVYLTFTGTPSAYVNVTIPDVGTYDPQLNEDGIVTFGIPLPDGTYTAYVTSIILDECETDLSEYSTVTFTVAECPLVYCDSYGESTENEWIDRVMHQYNDFDNASGDDGGYADYTSHTVEIEQGGKEGLKLFPGYPAENHWVYWRVWVDWNQDGVFDDSEKEIQKRAQSPITRFIIAPDDAELGLTTMRIAMTDGPFSNPCDIFSNGEVEDYTVMVIPAEAAPEVVEIIYDDINTNPIAETEIEIETEVELENNEEVVIDNDVETEMDIDISPEMDLSSISMKLYPNPTSDVLNIALNEVSDLSNLDLKIYNERGQLVSVQLPSNLSQDEMRISVEHLNPGIYMVVLRSQGKEITTERFIKIY